MCSGKFYLKEAYHAILQNDFQKAIDAFEKAIKCEPTNASYHYKLSITYSRNGDMIEALKSAKKAAELQPNNRIYRYHLQILQAKNLVVFAAYEMQNGILSVEVEKSLLQAKTLDPLNIEAGLLLGLYYGERGQLDLALNEFNQILNLEPVNKDAKQLKDYYLKKYQKGDEFE